jgi:hypothetical protein
MFMFWVFVPSNFRSNSCTLRVMVIRVTCLLPEFLLKAIRLIGLDERKTGAGEEAQTKHHYCGPGKVGLSRPIGVSDPLNRGGNRHCDFSARKLRYATVLAAHPAYNINSWPYCSSDLSIFVARLFSSGQVKRAALSN